MCVRHTSIQSVAKRGLPGVVCVMLSCCQTLRMTEFCTPNTIALSPSAYFDLRTNSDLPAGTCVYVQSADPGDFDGRLLIHKMGHSHRSKHSIDCDQNPGVVSRTFRMHLPVVRGVEAIKLSCWKPT